MKRMNGYQILDNYELIPRKQNSINTVYKLKFNNTSYFFKIQDTEEQFKELFYSILLQDRGIAAVQVDLAKFEGYKGTITPSYNPNNKEVYTMKEINEIVFQKAGNDIKKFYCLKQINETIYLFCKQKGLEYVNFKKEFLLKFIMQILLGNIDDHHTNTELIIDTPIYLSPLYDFGRCGQVKMQATFYDRYRFPYLEYPEKIEMAEETLQNFFKYGSKTEIETFKEYLEHMKSVKLKRVFNQSEELIEKRIPENIKLKLRRGYNRTLNDVSNVVKKYNR